MDFSDLAILVIGDVMLDHYISGNAAKISPEAPVPVVSKQKSWTVPGGAANVARGLARLGCEARLVGLTGRDGPGETLRQEVAAAGVVNAMAISESRPTICKTRILAHGQQLLRVDDETIQPPTLEEKIALRLNFANQLQGSSAVIFSDYAKGVLLRSRDGACICQELMAMAREAKLPVLVDPKGIDWDRYSGAQCVTPNTAEFIKVGESMGTEADEDDARKRASLANDLCSRFGLERLLLTRGAQGMNLFVPGQKTLRIPAAMREVADVSGAGDTVIATLAACVAKGLSWEESARIANVAAGIAVGKIGTAPVDIHELNQALQEKKQRPRIFTLEELRAEINDWRRNGEKIVFTNGCFDLLHPGHISLLSQCAAMGDKLVVGLNSDSSVQKLKGPDRPVQNEQARALVLAALESVDAVIIFSEETPEKLIREVRPDVLVKGGDYTLDKVVGARFVKSYGGQTRLVELVDGESTSAIVKRIRRNLACKQ